ncbi:MAG: ATP-binding protein [Kofleriaceae bacterium]
MSYALQHLRLRQRPVHRALVACAKELTGTTLSTKVVSLEKMMATGRTNGQAIALDADEEAQEQELRKRGHTLPLDRLRDDYDLEPFELEILLLCSLVETDASYGALCGMTTGDAARRRPTIALACSLGATSLVVRMQRAALLGRLGRLRRFGFVHATDGDTELDTELALSPAALAMITGRADMTFRDPLTVETSTRPRDLAGLRDARTIGVWGGTADARLDAARGLARRLGRPLRRPWEAHRPPMDVASAIERACADAQELGAVLWLDTDGFSGDVIAGCLHANAATVALTGRQPLRIPGIVSRAYVELQLASAGFEERRAMWCELMPDLEPAQADSLAGRYRLDRSAMAAAAAMARVTETVDQAVALVAQPRTLQFADVIVPRRTFADLVLPPVEETQLRELAETYLVWPHVAERWGFTTAVGVKALFTGEPGTGKTLSAEVIAGHLGLSLVRIDLARVVSKWVGETEKNLDAAFTEAEEAGAVLFFDEAEALFGKRGEVRHGTDRYANLEVSFLLQRLEEHDGLVILASNLRDEIDPAFVRRFQHVIHFLRPAERERLRLWRLAFPATAPLGDDLDFAVLARLDMTGAAIVSVARVAALSAARAGSQVIRVVDVVSAIASQFQREARAITATDLGPYGATLRTMRAS